jgi:hypothetical protein
MRVGGARVRARPGRFVLVVAGIAAANAALVGILGGSLIAQDRSVRRAVEQLPPAERSFRVDLIGLQGEHSYAGADRVAGRALSYLSPAAPLRITALRDSWLDSEFVRLAAADDLSRLVRLRSGRLPRSCTPSACEVVQIGGQGKARLSEGGITLVRTGIGDLKDVSVYGPTLAGLRRYRAQRSLVTSVLLLAAGASAFQHLPVFDTLYEDRAWISPVDPARLHSWQIGSTLARESRAQTLLEQADLAYTISGPDTALQAARSSAATSAQRMLLIGGGLSTLLLGFAIVAAISLRRGLAAEQRRLLQRGATRSQVRLAQLAEVGAITLAGSAIGIAAGIAGVAALGAAAGVPAGPILGHALLRPWSLLALVLSFVIATAVVLVAASTREQAGPLRRLRILDVAALGAALAVAVGLTRGGRSSDALASGNDRTLLLLLPGLVCFAGAVAVARLLRPLMFAGERLSRRGPLPLRLALLALARAPARTVATVAFLAVAVALALFAAGYRATLYQGARDESAFAVPLDVTLAEGAKLRLPIDLGSVGQYSRLAPGVAAYPVMRRSATLAGVGSSAQSVVVAGIPGAALARMSWRQDFSPTPRSQLVQAVTADGPAGLRGVPFAAGATPVFLPVRLRGARLAVELALRDERGRTTTVSLGTASPGSSTLTGRIPAGPARRVVALELSLPEGERDWFFHNDIEGRTVRVPSGSITIGPLRTPARPLVAWRGWLVRGRGARLVPGGSTTIDYSFPEIETLVVRRPQPTDGHPLRVIASPEIARAAAPDGALELDFDGAAVPARIVGVARRFPTIPAGEPFAVAEQSRLATTLDADGPGTGTPEELWLSVPGSADGRVRAALARLPFTNLVRTSRRTLLANIEHDPLTRGIVYTLGVSALVALALALIGFWVALLGDLRDERGDFFDLEAQGVSPATLVRHLRLRALALLGFGLAAGLGLSAVLAQLVVSLVRVSVQAGAPEPPLVYRPGWATILPVLAALLAVAVAAAELSARQAFGGETPRRASWSLE